MIIAENKNGVINASMNSVGQSKGWSDIFTITLKSQATFKYVC